MEKKSFLRKNLKHKKAKCPKVRPFLEYFPQSPPKVQENKVFWIYLNFSKMESAVMSVDVSLRSEKHISVQYCHVECLFKFFKSEFLKHINLYVQVKTIILYCSQLNLVLLSQAGLSIVPVSSWPSGVDNSQRTYGRPTNGLFWFCGIHCCPCQFYQTWPQLKWERCH